MIRRTRIKVCCIRSREEADLALQAGADAIGLVTEMPTGPGMIADATARDIARTVLPGVETFLLTSRSAAQDIAEQVLDIGASAVQVVRHLDPAEYPRLLELLPPSIRRVQVVHIKDDSSLALIEAYRPFVHAVLLDSGDPDTAELGGTGRTHDWAVSARFVARAGRPVILAGGLSPANVASAIAHVQPYGVDVCTGLRPDRPYQPELLRRFVGAVRAADHSHAHAPSAAT